MIKNALKSYLRNTYALACVAAVVCAGLVFTACGSDDSSGSKASAKSKTTLSSAPTEAELVAAAKKEGGEVVTYTYDADLIGALKKGFEAKYPFAKVNFTVGGLTDIASKVISEHEAGAVKGDVAQFTGGQVGQFADAKALTPLTLPNQKALPPEVVDPDGNWHAFDQFLIVGAYNTKLLPNGLPKDLYDLIKPEWKGKLVMDAPQNLSAGSYVLASHRMAWGEDKWMKWLKGLKANGIQITGDATSAYEAVVRGEKAATIALPYNDFATQKKGTPVDINYYDGLVVHIPPAGALAGAPHPAGAALFINYMQSPEGQAVIAKTGRPPVLPGVDSPVAMENILPKDAKLAPVEEARALQDHPDKYLSVWNELWPR